jgi:hypothetical protein
VSLNETETALVGAAPNAPSGESASRKVAERSAGRSPYLVIDEVAERYRVSTHTVQWWVASRSCPHFRRQGSRRVLFRPDWLDAWDAGAELEVVELSDNGRVCRPVQV